MSSQTIDHSVTSYRPHNPGHDYHASGIYLITLVIRNRRQQPTLLGHLNDDIKAPALVLSNIGEAVLEEWEKTPDIQKTKGNELSLLNQVCMPDHWHGVIQVHRTMNKSLGHIVQYVKSACTARWRAITYSPLDSSSSQAIRGMSEKQRNAYYATLPLTQQPLWDDEYDDTICLCDPITGTYDRRHLSAMLRYVEDNPRRAIMRRLRPQFMQRCLHVRMSVKDAKGSGQMITRDYAAFGNLFLLRWARKVQVFCHRKARYGTLTADERMQYYGEATYDDTFVTRIPYEQTAAFRQDCAHWKAQVMAGVTVVVTPGISKGEQIIKDRCLESGYPLIHLQKEPIGTYWKPEERRFNACSRGSLLILAPWQPEALGDVNQAPSDSNYAMFHNLNMLAAEICNFEEEATLIF